jgi:hypothetical protein
VPAFFAVLRPKAIREDRVYGPLLRKAIQLARDRSKVVSAIRMADSAEDAEEVIFATSGDPEAGGEGLLVENGVRADIDPSKLVDDDGHPLWSAGPPGPLRELLHEGETPERSLSLFELPGRTWVVVPASARERAREVFAHPRHHHLAAYSAQDPRDLAFIRLDGPALVSHVTALKRAPNIGTIGENLGSAVFSLPPGAAHELTLSLHYLDGESASAAETVLRQTFSALGRKGSPALSWLGNARVERSDTAIEATAPLPPSLVSALVGGEPPPPNR